MRARAGHFAVYGVDEKALRRRKVNAVEFRRADIRPGLQPRRRLHDRRHRLHPAQLLKSVHCLVVEKCSSAARGIARRGYVDLREAPHRFNVFPVSCLVAETDRDENDDAHHADRHRQGRENRPRLSAGEIDKAHAEEIKKLHTCRASF